MSETIGIHLGERRFHLVALEGGLKKHKLVCTASGEIPVGEDAAQQVIERLREVVKEHKLGADSVYLAIDSGVAAYRSLTLPFDDRAKIEEVIKFEVESNLPQYDIEQVVIDFLVLSSKPGVESNLLVTAVPKERLRGALRMCERAGLEPLDAELEGTALFDAAFESGVLSDDKTTVLIHVGDASTTVAIADGRRLAGLRAIRVSTLDDEVAPSTDADTGGEKEKQKEKQLAATGGSENERRAAMAQRIRRELSRTMAGVRTANEVGAIYLCGHDLPGLSGATLLDLPVQPLPFTPGPVENAQEYVVALGAALRGFDGGTLRPSLRREELRFTGRFERLELPLAVCSLLLFTLLVVQFIVLDKQLEWRDEGDLAKGSGGDMQMWLEASNQRMLPDPTNTTGSTRAVRLPSPPKALADYAALAQAGGDEPRTKFQEVQHIHELLKQEINTISRELGQVSEIKQPQSALNASTLVMSVISSLGEEARLGIRRFEASYVHGQSGKEDSVTVTLDVDFFGKDSIQATHTYSQLENKFREQPWCVDFEGKASKVLEGDKGIYYDGLTIQVNVDKAQPGGQP